jgi:hypothetical protein
MINEIVDRSQEHINPYAVGTCHVRKRWGFYSVSHIREPSNAFHPPSKRGRERVRVREKKKPLKEEEDEELVLVWTAG